jgi:glycosyltransferase involved in cell wall biosynthesis
MIKVSIIIPTYNEASVIRECLESLGTQSMSDFEVVVVDDGSTDSTFKILSELKVPGLDLKIMQGAHLGAGAARNLGAKQAEGKILVFVDADMSFSKDFIGNLIKPIVLGESKGTFSRDENVSNWDNVWARCWNVNEGWEKGKRHPKNYPDRQPVFRAILKSEFDRVWGFTPGGYDDDWSLSRKLGYEATLAPNAIFYHKNPGSLGEIYKHAKWVGKRKYKYGFLGFIVGMVRASLPISIIIGVYKSIKHLLPAFLIFKIVYDLGILIGIMEFLISGKSSK